MNTENLRAMADRCDALVAEWVLAAADALDAARKEAAEIPDLLAARLHASGKAETMHARWLAATQEVEAAFREGYVKGHADGVTNTIHAPTLAWAESRSRAALETDR